MKFIPTAILTIRNGTVTDISMDRGMCVIVDDYVSPDETKKTAYTRTVHKKP